MVSDVVIIGAGPGGLAAALQLRRSGLTVRLLEGNRVGGLLWNANLVENYPGFPQGIPGPELVKIFVNQAITGGVEITQELASELTWQADLFHVTTIRGTYQARTAIIASGTKPRPLSGFPIAAGVFKHIFYEVASLHDLTNKKIIIIGGGDAAFDYALNMARRNSVIIVNRSERSRCLPLLQQRAYACETITYHPGTVVLNVDTQPGGGLRVECSSPHGLLTLQADTLIGAIGRDPNLDFVCPSVYRQRLDLESRGILHYIGDVDNGLFRQTAIAVGDGIHAGMHIARVLKETADEGNCLDWKG